MTAERVSPPRRAGGVPIRWIVVAAGLLVAAGIALAVKWVATASTSGSGLQPPKALPPAKQPRAAFMVARRANDVLVGLKVPPRGPIDVTAIPADQQPLPAGAVSVTLGGAKAAASACGPTCYRVRAPAALTRPLALTVAVARPGKPTARATFALPRALPATANGLFDAVTRRMQAVRSYRVDETLSSGLSGIRARFLYRAPDRMSYVTSEPTKAIVIGGTRWDSQGGGAWQRSSSPGVHVPTYMWDGAASPRSLGTTVLGGRRVRVLSVFRPDKDFPAWFRLYVRSDDRVVRADMLAPAHFMVDRLSRFDQPLSITPPAAPTTKPTVWDQMRPIGVGRRYQPAALSAGVRRAAAVGGLACRTSVGPRVGAHLEVFANERVVIIPAGVGIAPPQRRDGVYVRGGRCSYAARTIEPTGVIHLDPRRRVTVGQFFALWGQPLTSRRLAGFTARPGTSVRAYVAGRRWQGDPRAIVLSRHAQVVLEVNGYVPPHSRYLFPPGL